MMCGVVIVTFLCNYRHVSTLYSCFYNDVICHSFLVKHLSNFLNKHFRNDKKIKWYHIIMLQLMDHMVFSCKMLMSKFVSQLWLVYEKCFPADLSWPMTSMSLKWLRTAYLLSLSTQLGNLCVIKYFASYFS